MKVKGLTPILNVSDIKQSFAWFKKLGWEKRWDWGDPPGFGSVGCDKYEIFLCKDGQGSRGGPMPRHAGDDDTGGTWMTWWVESRRGSRCSVRSCDATGRDRDLASH